MNNEIYQELRTTFEELEYHLNIQFTEVNFYYDDRIEHFFKKVYAHLPQKDDNSSYELKNYYALLNWSYQKAKEAICHSNKELFNKTLKTIWNETEIILDLYQDNLE